MDWTWLLNRPSRDGKNVVRFEDWLLWHYHILLPKGNA